MKLRSKNIQICILLFTFYATISHVDAFSRILRKEKNPPTIEPEGAKKPNNTNISRDGISILPAEANSKRNHIPGSFSDSPTPSLMNQGKSTAPKPAQTLTRNMESIHFLSSSNSGANEILQKNSRSTISSPSNNLSDVKSNPINVDSKRMKVPGSFPDSPTPSLIDRSKSTASKPAAITIKNIKPIRVPGTFPDSPTPSITNQTTTKPNDIVQKTSRSTIPPPSNVKPNKNASNADSKQQRIPGSFPDSPAPSVIKSTASNPTTSKTVASKPITTKNNNSKRVPGSFPDFESNDVQHNQPKKNNSKKPDASSNLRNPFGKSNTKSNL